MGGLGGYDLRGADDDSDQLVLMIHHKAAADQPVGICPLLRPRSRWSTAADQRDQQRVLRRGQRRHRPQRQAARVEDDRNALTLEQLQPERRRAGFGEERGIDEVKILEKHKDYRLLDRSR